jgi:hypothetical protein
MQGGGGEGSEIDLRGPQFEGRGKEQGHSWDRTPPLRDPVNYYQPTTIKPHYSFCFNL